MQINGAPAFDYQVRPGLLTVTSGPAYEHEQARIYAGIPIADWDAMPGIPLWIDPAIGGRSKAEIVILYRMSNFIPAAQSDAQIRDSERNRHRRGGR